MRNSFSDAQRGRNEGNCLLVRARFRIWALMACPRGLHAGFSAGVALDRDGVLLYRHLLGDLASYETSISHDISANVSFPFSISFLFKEIFEFSFQF